jgi:hypothetical protein
MPRNILRERQRERTLLRAGVVGRPPARPRRARRRRPKPKTNIRRRKATKRLSSRIEMDRKRERGGAKSPACRSAVFIGLSPSRGPVGVARSSETERRRVNDIETITQGFLLWGKNLVQDTCKPSAVQDAS